MSKEQDTHMPIHNNVGISKEDIIKIAAYLSESLCMDVVAYDVRELYDYVDFSIVATTTSNIHRRGIIDKLTDFFYQHDFPTYAKLSSLRIKEQQQGGWILVDYYDFLIHLVDDDVRKFYNFEQLLSKAKLIYTLCET